MFSIGYFHGVTQQTNKQTTTKKKTFNKINKYPQMYGRNRIKVRQTLKIESIKM